MRAPALALVAVVALGAAPLAGAKPPPAPDRVQVRGLEYDLMLSRAKLTPGRAIVQFLNAGEDAHDLRLQRLDPSGAQVGPELGVGEVEPGAYENIDAHLRSAPKNDVVVFACRPPRARHGGVPAHSQAPAPLSPDAAQPRSLRSAAVAAVLALKAPVIARSPRLEPLDGGRRPICWAS